LLSSYFINDKFVFDPAIVLTVNSFAGTSGKLSYVLNYFMEMASYGLRINLEILFQISDFPFIEFIISSSVV
jgi:hypothetical protein